MAGALFITHGVLTSLFILSHVAFDKLLIGSVVARKLENISAANLISEQNTPADGYMFHPTTSEANTPDLERSFDSVVRKNNEKLDFECSPMNTNITKVYCDRLNNESTRGSNVLTRNKLDKTFELSVSNKLYECYHGQFVYHNITIATNDLPPLLRPATQQIKFESFSQFFGNINLGTTVFETKDFLSLKHLHFENQHCRTEVLLTFVIFSSTFDEILNPGHSKYPLQRERSVFEVTSLCNFQDACFPKSTPVCYCDNICTVYDDCCLNYRDYDKNSPEVELHTLKKPFMSCLENEYISPNNFAGYWVVSECPNDQDFFDKQDQYSVLKQRCEVAFDYAFFVPVVSTKTQIHYRNAYCALCHNEDIYVHWGQEKPFKLGSFEKHNSSKVISVQPPFEYEARVCYNFTFTDCPARAEESLYSRQLRKLCRSHQNPIKIEQTLNQTSFPNFTEVISIHRNLYCFVCNTHYVLHHVRTCLAVNSKQLYDFSSYGWLFRTDHLLYVPSGYKRCRSGETWQSFLNKCVKIACPRFQTPYAGGCEAITSRTQTEKLTFSFYIKGNLTDKIYSFFIWRFARRVIVKFPGSSVLYAKSLSQTLKDRFLVLIVQARFQGIVSASDLSKFSVFKHWTYMYSTNSKTDLVFIPTFLINHQREREIKYIPGVYKPLFFSSILRNERRYYVNTSVLCVPYSIEKMETHNRGNKEIETCASSSQLKMLTSLDNIRSLTAPIEEVVSTYLSMGSSSMALLVMLYRFKRIKSLSSIKQILFHCMLVKLLSQVTFMIGCGANDVKLVCYIIGVVLHYLWLSAFVWSSVCAYFFYYVFVIALRNIKNAILTHSSSIKPFIVIGYTLPLLFVFVSVSIDFMKDDGEWSYGERICFITGRETLLFGFAFPTCFMVYLNLIFFFTTIFHMGKRDLFITSWKTKFNRYYPICVEMSVLLSLTWGLGFFASWLNSQTFWILFIWMDGLQGCLLCATFFPCKSVLKSLKTISTNSI